MVFLGRKKASGGAIGGPRGPFKGFRSPWLLLDPLVLLIMSISFIGKRGAPMNMLMIISFEGDVHEHFLQRNMIMIMIMFR